MENSLLGFVGLSREHIYTQIVILYNLILYTVLTLQRDGMDFLAILDLGE